MRILISLILVSLIWPTGHAQEPISIKADQVKYGWTLMIDTEWKVFPGEHPNGADPELDDANWQTWRSRFSSGDKPAWPGQGWFRLHVRVDEALWGKPLGLQIRQNGASEVYLNGELVAESGKVASNADEERRGRLFRPRAIAFAAQSEQVIAVRYSNHEAMAARGEAGFTLWLQDMRYQVDYFIKSERGLWGRVRGFGAVYGAFGLLHLILFLFSPKSRSNLFFALFNLEAAGYTAWLLFANTSETFDLEFNYGLVERLTVPTVLFTLLLFTYSLFHKKFPKTWLLFAAIAVVGTVLSFFMIAHLLWLMLIFTLEIMRVAGAAIIRRERYAWLFGLGLGATAMSMLLTRFNQSALYQSLIDLVVAPPPYWGVLFLIVCMSIYLSLEEAFTNKNLALQLVEVKRLSSELVARERREKEREIERRLLEADNARKTKELEEARHFQLSMLPKSLPDLPKLTCAASMQTATEVGGDYYDFHLEKDGTLTVAVGDATGHGTRAGTMVAAVKGLFSLLAPKHDITDLFKETNRSLKRMQMKQMFMAMTLIRFRENALAISAAGMPPAYLYRAENGMVEEIRIKALPLGGIPFPYQQQEFHLAPGDTLLITSDGLPELFNNQGAMFKDHRVKTIFSELANEAPDQIIAGLEAAAEAWRGDHPLEDDTTLFVIKFQKDPLSPN